MLQAPAADALRRPAAARGDGPGDRARAAGVPDGRAALEPRREAARRRCAPRSRGCSASSASTTIYVTHDQVEAMTMGTRIAVMRKGVLQQQGPPQELYDQPPTCSSRPSSARPPMNLFRARVDGSRGRGALPSATSGFRCPRRRRPSPPTSAATSRSASVRSTSPTARAATAASLAARSGSSRRSAPSGSCTSNCRSPGDHRRGPRDRTRHRRHGGRRPSSARRRARVPFVARFEAPRASRAARRSTSRSTPSTSTSSTSRPAPPSADRCRGREPRETYLPSQKSTITV